MAEKYLIVGLGNPGPFYCDTRHNVGAAFLDFVARKHSLIFSLTGQQALVANGFLWQVHCILSKPVTFMNRSGEAVSALAELHGLAPEYILVVHDDIDLPWGRVKLTAGGGAGGHRGVGSVIDYLGTTRFPRMKLGIGRPADATPIEQYVLAPLNQEERAILNARLVDLEEGLRLFLSSGITEAMNVVNRRSMSETNCKNSDKNAL
jgi:PTH1 family peptidyl-tRNA hydrolase